MKEKTCCFTGHRNIPEREIEYLRTRVEEELEALIGKGVVYFGSGGARGFDLLAAETVIMMKEKYPHIKLILVLPCAGYMKLWKEDDIAEYEWVKHNADKVKILSPIYYTGCMHTRNRHMVNCSSYCICYCRKNKGGTYYTKNYAIANKLKVIFI